VGDGSAGELAPQVGQGEASLGEGHHTLEGVGAVGLIGAICPRQPRQPQPGRDQGGHDRREQPDIDAAMGSLGDLDRRRQQAEREIPVGGMGIYREHRARRPVRHIQVLPADQAQDETGEMSGNRHGAAT